MANTNNEAEKEPTVRRHRVMTPYEAAKLVNRRLAREGIVNPKTGKLKEIGSPMMYIYRDRGRFESKKANDGRWEVDEASFEEFLDTYIEKTRERMEKEVERQEEEAE